MSGSLCRAEREAEVRVPEVGPAPRESIPGRGSLRCGHYLAAQLEGHSGHQDSLQDVSVRLSGSLWKVIVGVGIGEGLENEDRGIYIYLHFPNSHP